MQPLPKLNQKIDTEKAEAEGAENENVLPDLMRLVLHRLDRITELVAPPVVNTPRRLEPLQQQQQGGNILKDFLGVGALAGIVGLVSLNKNNLADFKTSMAKLGVNIGSIWETIKRISMDLVGLAAAFAAFKVAKFAGGIISGVARVGGGVVKGVVGAGRVAGKSWAAFAEFVERKMGAKIAARVAAGVANTGVGLADAAPTLGVGAFISLMIDIGLAAWTAYDLWNLYMDFMGTKSQTQSKTSPTQSTPPTPEVSESASGRDDSEAFIPSGDKKQDIALSYFMKNLGLSQFQAAGIVGNLLAESNLDTNAFNKAGGGKGAYGIAQWRGKRLEGLQSFAKSKGKSVQDYNVQLEYVAQELRTTYSSTLMSLKGAKDSQEATKIFLNKFEAPSESEKAQSINRRLSNASKVSDGKYVPTKQSKFNSSDVYDTEEQKPQLDKILGLLGGLFRGDTHYVSLDSIAKEGSINYINKQQQDNAVSMMPPKTMQATSTVPPSFECIDPNYSITSGDVLHNYLLFFGV